MRKILIKSVAAVAIAAALSGCNNEPPAKTANNERAAPLKKTDNERAAALKAAANEREAALQALKTAAEANKAGIAGEIATGLGEDQAALERLIAKLQTQLKHRDTDTQDTKPKETSHEEQ